MFWKNSPEERADVLGERLLAAVPEFAGFMLSELSKRAQIELSGIKTEQFFVELTVFYMHLLDRMAFSRLGAAGRDRFSDRLIGVVSHGFMASLHTSLSSVDFVARFRDTYNRRQTEYARCRDLAARPGQPPKNTLFWEFGKVIWGVTGDNNPATLMLLSGMLTGVPTILSEALKADQVLR